MNKKNGQLSVYVCIHVKIMNTLITVINPRCHEGNSCWREDEGWKGSLVYPRLALN